MLLSSDGGIVSRSLPVTNPDGTPASAWTSINGSVAGNCLSLMQDYAVAYDANYNRVLSAAQDTGVSVQNVSNQPSVHKPLSLVETGSMLQSMMLLDQLQNLQELLLFYCHQGVGCLNRRQYTGTLRPSQYLSFTPP